MDRKHAMPPQKQSSRGFSLIEAMVVVAVAAVVAATAVPSLVEFIDGRRLDATATALAADLQFVRTEAVARNQTVRISFHEAPAGTCWVVHTGPPRSAAAMTGRPRSAPAARSRSRPSCSARPIGSASAPTSPRSPSIRCTARARRPAPCASSTAAAARCITSSTSWAASAAIDDAAFAGAKTSSVAVEWADRGGVAQRIVLDSVIARSDPLWSGALAVGASLGAPRGSLGRSPFVPVTARSLGGGRSALKTTTSGGSAIVFDDRSGEIVSRCTGIAATTATRDLMSSDLAACSEGRWQLLAGTVRFSGAVPPLAGDAQNLPLPLTISLALVGGTYAAPAECSSEAMKTVRWSAGGNLRIEAVPLDAEPASLGLGSWQDTGDRHAAYRCIVTPRADGRWSGRSLLVASGWTIGSGSGDHRVCRYTTDADGSGAIDANIEHPADYVDVAGPLLAQNFLVVRGDQSCPVGTGGDSLTAGIGTVPHQP